MTRPIHVVHVLYRFAAGGLENVLVQLINGLPHDRFRHTVIALTSVDDAFASRITRADVEVIALNKSPGQPFALYPRMHRLLRRLRPDVVHSCNIAALEFMPVAAFVGVPRRVHAEHGWDVADPDGSNACYRVLRRIYKPFVHAFVAVSLQLHVYLKTQVRVKEDRLYLIENGVDTQYFRPRREGDSVPEDFPFDPGLHFIFGSVARFEPIKNPRLLADAFISLARRPGGEKLRLVMVGEGPLRKVIQDRLLQAGLADQAWLPGARADIPSILRMLGCFVLPSLAEGTSCTLQEAMASACEIIATDVGGNADLLENGRYGRLVATDNVESMADAMQELLMKNEPLGNSDGRARIERDYALEHTLRRYCDLFGG